MTETPEPASADGPVAAEPDSPADPAAPRRRSLFSNVNRTNRIAAWVLCGMAAVFAAALLFGAGVLVGAEYGESGADRHASEGYDHEDGGWGESRHSDDDWETTRDSERDDGDETGSRGDGGESDRAPRSGAPEGPPPSQSNGPPRP